MLAQSLQPRAPGTVKGCTEAINRSDEVDVEVVHCRLVSHDLPCMCIAEQSTSQQ